MEKVNTDRKSHGRKFLKVDSDDDNNCEPFTHLQKKRDSTSKKTTQSCLLMKLTQTVISAVFFMVKVTSGNVHDSVPFDDVYNKVVWQFPDVHAFVADSAYKTLYICKRFFLTTEFYPQLTRALRQ